MKYHSTATAKASLCILILIVSFNSMLAANDPDIVQVFEGKNGCLKPDSVREISDLIFDNPTTRSRINLSRDQQYINTITLLVNEQTNIYIPIDFKVEVTFDVKYMTPAGNILYLNGQKLQVSYNKGEGIKYDSRQYLSFKDGRYVKVTIKSVNTFNATWDVMRVIRLESRMQITRDYHFNCSEKVVGLSDDGYFNSGQYTKETDELKIKWGMFPLSGLTHFDVQWAWCDQNVIDRYKLNGVFNTDLIFVQNSSEVRILNQFDPTDNGPNYKIPLFYDGQGYLFYRVRPVQYTVNGQVITGTWSTEDAITFFQFDGHQSNMNWQSGTAYAEDGKRKTVVQYFDGTLRSRQTVTKDNSKTEDNNYIARTVIAETFYDYQGRPVIEVLPAPTLNTIIQYAQNFNRFQTSSGVNINQKDIYDLMGQGGSICSALTPPLQKLGGASQYYSDNNAKVNEGKNKFIPDASGYPYKQIVYTNDGSGRIQSEGGVGIKHQPGSGHETKFFYGSVSQPQLDGLFGTEAGDASHYFKNMVRDANGQYSVTYTDMKGRTIATALAGDNPANLKELQSHHDLLKSATPITESLISDQNNIVQGTQIIANKTLLVPKAGNYTFNYELHPESAEIIACNPAGEKVCYDCLYDLEIRVSNSCATYSKVLTRSNFSLSAAPDLNCNMPSPAITVLNEVLNLPEGEYDISKTLSLSKYSQNWYRENIFRKKNICKTIQQFFDSTFQVMLTETNCAPSCEKCRLALGSYAGFREKYLQSQGVDPSTSVKYEDEIIASYKENKKHCDELCETVNSKLEGLKMQMLADMTPPAGQYADLNGILKPFNIYNNLYNRIVPGAVRYKSPLDEMSFPDFYKNSLDQIDKDAHPDNSQHTVVITTPQEFESKFKSSWATSLLPYHPEYCKYKIAVDLLSSSYAFDEKLEGILTYAVANTPGNNYTTSIIDLDPFFAVNGPGAAYRQAMKNKIEYEYKKIKLGFSSISYSMWQIAWLTINCNDKTSLSCASTAPKFPPFNNTCKGDIDKIWQIFRTLYLSEKNDFINDLLNIKCPSYPSNLYIVLNQNNYQRRFGSVNEMFGSGYLNSLINFISTLPNPPAIQNENGIGPAQDSIRASYEATCDGYKSLWLEQLNECDQIKNMDAVLRNKFLQVVTESLKDICVRGSDVYHFLGSASEKPGDPRKYDDFEEVLQNVFAQFGISISSVCHPYLITYPKKYTQQTTPSSLDLVLQKDSCVCNKLSELKIKKDEDGYSGSLADFIGYKYGVNVTQGLLDSLQYGCSDEQVCKTFDPSIKIPGFLTCYSPVETCISCDEYANYKRSFHTAYPRFDRAPFNLPSSNEEVKANLFFQSFMNYKTGFQKSWSEYLTFEKACENYSSEFECKYLDSLVQAFNNQYGDSLYGSNCQTLFLQFFNQVTGNFYTYPDLQIIFMKSCGHLPDVCRPKLTCLKFEEVITDFLLIYADSSKYASFECKGSFTQTFNDFFETNYSWNEIQQLYEKICGGELDICETFSCRNLNQLLIAFANQYNGLAWLYPDCEQRFVLYFNNYFHTNLPYEEIRELYAHCNVDIQVCNPSIDCETLQRDIKSYYSADDNCISTLDRNSPSWCKDCFTNYINDLLGVNYTYEQIALLYRKVCNETMKICEEKFTCDELNEFFSRFTENYTGNTLQCRLEFVRQFNEKYQTQYSFTQVEAAYMYYCGSMPAICTVVEIQSCSQLSTIADKFRDLYPDAAGYFGGECQQAFANFFNEGLGTKLRYDQIIPYYISLCGKDPAVCTPSNCNDFISFLTSFNTSFSSFTLPQLLKRELFTKLFNEKFQPKEPHYWKDIIRIYQSCGIELTVAPEDSGELISCKKMFGLKKAFYTFYPGALPEKCEDIFTGFFNLYYDNRMSFVEINAWFKEHCNTYLNICGERKEEEYVMLKAEAALMNDVIMPPRLCGLNKPVYPEITEDSVHACDYIKILAHNSATEQYNLYVQQQLSNFDMKYQERCLSAKKLEKFTVTYLPAEYHYTLYYYDQAGNLVKTVPPSGVHPRFTAGFLDSVEMARAGGWVKTPEHTMKTEYKYNSLSQVTTQISPDAGVSKFWYDRLGRLVVSQNAKQAEGENGFIKYSYTMYDQLGRIKEVGEILKQATASAMSQVISESESDLAAWLNSPEKKQQITCTVYDQMYPPFCDLGSSRNILCQKNLRNRVSFSYIKKHASNDIDYPWDAATFYSYDIHGNVDTMLQDYKTGMGSIICTNNLAGNRFKKFGYAYDLISGKVNMVSYQAGQSDQFFQRYSYDAENKLTAAESSKDQLYWEKEAAYDYYRHGALARTTVGDNNVQGIDYVYTLQGWLKGVNSTAVSDGIFDAGNDGKVTGQNKMVARDAFGFSLNYFNNDYAPINSTSRPFATLPLTTATNNSAPFSATELFNGNIGAMAVNIAKFNDTKVYGYMYDQLNRLINMEAYNTISNATNIFSTSGPMEDYKEEISYDPNGNILTYMRNGAAAEKGLAMDSLTYNYDYFTSTGQRKTYNPALPVPADAQRLTNQLNSVGDVAVENYTEDINNQEQNNYKYDAIGNLICDKAEGLYDAANPDKPMIEWNVYGKISHITKIKDSITTNIDYEYDAAGNRISKTVNGNSTYYVRDAAGNVMSVYKSGETSVNSGHLSQTELHLYGSSRIGIFKVAVDVQTCLNGTDPVTTFTRGNKYYELNNHLGNVLVTISDKKLQQSINGATVDYYTADVMSAQDYYPFGMSMVGRSYRSSGYRYGFNGKENDNDVKDQLYDYGFRIYDSRISRFISRDPLFQSFPFYTPYQYAGNKPIWRIDLDGLEDAPSTANSVEDQASKRNRKVVVDPGHGGDDGGTPKKSYKLNEADITLKVGCFINERLTALTSINNGSVNITMTRDKDINPGGKGQHASLDARVKIAKGADIFVSVHVDAALNTAADKVTVYTKVKADQISKDLQSNVIKALTGIAETKQGIYSKEASFQVLRDADKKTAAVLVEIGYITNPEQEQNFNNETYLQKLGNSLAEGIFASCYPNASSSTNRNNYVKPIPPAPENIKPSFNIFNIFKQ